jgi:trk system potassium uptake protein TrkH
MLELNRVRAMFLVNPLRILPVSFAVIIVIGTALLLLPISTSGNRETSLLDAIFTATSAVCVTGLSVVDTAAHWSVFGQGVILALIQIGGLGIVTVVSIAVLLVSDRIGLSHTRVLGADVGTETYSGIGPLVRSVVITTLIFEVLFAAVLAFRFFVSHDYELSKALLHGVFHSVSAWNNAGFALYSDNFVSFAGDWFISIALCIAVILGGLGFPVLRAMARQKTQWHLWSLHSKLTVVTTLVLIVIGTFLFLILEWSNSRTLGALPEVSRPLAAFFHSVQTRTAGFNSVDTAALSEESLVVSIILMFIGGGSGSTAGGIKVTTFALLAFVIWAEFRGDRDVNMFGRRISEEVQRQALTIALVAVGIFSSATLLLMMLSDVSLSIAAFEVVSALSTVGLSTGVTANEGSLSQILLTVLMFIGRVGPVTLAAAITLRSRPHLFRYPTDRPLLG